MSDLVERLREKALEADKEAWRRRDGGQEYSMGAMLADEAADRIEALEAENARLRERLQAIIDWSDLAQSRPAEFSSAEARMLRGPIFDRARAAMEPQP